MNGSLKIIIESKPLEIRKSKKIHLVYYIKINRSKNIKFSQGILIYSHDI